MDVTAQARADSTFNDRYELTELLGQGGMGAVHRGVQRALNRPVAIKFMAPELAREPGYASRFLAEAQLAASLVHGSVVTVFDFGLVDGVPYIVTEFIPGQDLNDLLKEGATLSVADTLAIARGTLDGLAAIHKLGIVHRDIKPANLQVLPGTPPSVKILDFGIAKQTGGAPLSDGAPRTATGMVMGTPEFMAPEQASGDKLTTAADIYAFSLILFRMIVGQHPFRAESTLELLRMQILTEVEVPGHVLPAFRELLQRGLAKRPQDRVGSAQEMRALLDRAAPEAESTGSFFRKGAGTQAVMIAPATDQVPARFQLTAPTAKAEPPIELAPATPARAMPATVPTAIVAPARAPLGRVAWTALVLVVALGAVFAMRSAAEKPWDTWNHDWSPPFARVPVRTEPMSLEQVAQIEHYNVDEPGSSGEGSHLQNPRKLPDGQWAYDFTFDGQDNNMYYHGFTPAGGALVATTGVEPAILHPGRRLLIDDGGFEVDYGGVQNPGMLELQLLGARRDDRQSAVIYRLRVDLAHPGYEVMVSDPADCVAEVARGHGMRSYHFRPSCWRMVSRQDDASLAKAGKVGLRVKERTLTVTVNGATHTHELGEVYAAQPGTYYPRLYVYPNTALSVQRATITGAIGRGNNQL